MYTKAFPSLYKSQSKSTAHKIVFDVDSCVNITSPLVFKKFLAWNIHQSVIVEHAKLNPTFNFSVDTK